MIFDAFISHASEDKELFVRKLSEELQNSNVAVWYDEFSLKVGDSLRRSIDHGLSKSRFGIVILSNNFIGKKWPEWELDGLVQRFNSQTEMTILPVWLDITYEEVLAFSPPLADKFALNAQKGIDYVVKELLKVIKPQGSFLVVARERLIELGYNAPVVTDDWWHSAIEYCGSNPMEGSFQDAMGWGHWGFPLPPSGSTTKEKGERIAWAALQLNWQSKSLQNRFSQLNHPETILSFIDKTPGLKETCHNNLHYLATYAPQLTIKGFGGEFELGFDNWLKYSIEKQEHQKEQGSISGSGLTIDGSIPLCDEPIALHHETFGNYEPATIASFFVQGHIMGPDVKVFDTIDYFVWFLSDESSWLPEKVKNFLLQGMKEWSLWTWSEYDNHSDFLGNFDTGKLYKALTKAKSLKDFKLTRPAMKDIESRFKYSIEILNLPENEKDLRERFLESKAIEEYFNKNKRRK